MASEPGHLIFLNDRNTFIEHDGGRNDAGWNKARLSRKKLAKLLPSTVVDGETLELVQIRRLHEAVDYTISATGSAALFRSLAQPSTDLALVRARQESLREIASDDRLRNALEDCAHQFAQAEPALYKFFNKRIYALFPYLDVKNARKTICDLVKTARALPPSGSSYLRDLTSVFSSFQGTSLERMISGAIYKTFDGLTSDREVGMLTPRRKFVSRRFTQWLLAGPAVAAAPLLCDKIGLGLAISPSLTHLGLAWTGLYALYGLLFKPVRDTENFVEPLRSKCVGERGLGSVVDALAAIDELLSFHRFAKEFAGATVLPEVADEDRHFFEAAGLASPMLGKDNPGFVPNDIRMNGARLTFVSGPNSGGKTTICKSIAQNQLLAQAGAYVAAKTANVGLADRIAYQAPKFDGLQDDEGRFGTELARTRDIFFSTSPKSLVILDELAEGTTVEERLKTSFGIMNDFHSIGNNTVLVTHNHSLVDRFMEENKGQALMAEFQEDAPTYRIVSGISRVSHAEKIAERIGFSDQDRLRYLEKKGYLQQRREK